MNTSLNIHSEIKETIENLSLQQLKNLMIETTLKVLEPDEAFNPPEYSGLSMTDGSTLEACLSGNDWVYFHQWISNLVAKKVS